VLDWELEEAASPIAPDTDGATNRFEANVFTSSGPGVEKISLESPLIQRGALWKPLHEARSEDP